MKKCTRCEVEKELTEFWQRKDRGTGYHTICKQCMNSDRKNRNAHKLEEIYAKQREGYQKHRQKRLKWMHDYWENLSDEKKDEIREKKRISFQNSQEQKRKKAEYLKNVYDQQKYKANMQVSDAIRRGKLVKPTHCQVCNTEDLLDGHHSDYSKPLQVLWVCRKCHVAIHKSLKEGTNANYRD